MAKKDRTFEYDDFICTACSAAERNAQGECVHEQAKMRDAENHALDELEDAIADGDMDLLPEAEDDEPI